MLNGSTMLETYASSTQAGMEMTPKSQQPLVVIGGKIGCVGGSLVIDRRPTQQATNGCPAAEVASRTMTRTPTQDPRRTHARPTQWERTA